MANERAILCGNVLSTSLPFGVDKPLKLHLWGPHENVSILINNISSQLLKDVSSKFHDLLEIATYVYCADQAVTRGGDGVDNLGQNWRRKLFFRIPVRNPDLWNDPNLKEKLVSTLSFLSEDEYYFDFIKLTDEPPTQRHLDFELVSPEEVILFSGGLDSLAGAVEEAVIDGRKVALVTHRSTSKLARRHRKLLDLLKKHAKYTPLYIPVVINKIKNLGREHTQRTRSFLYAALGATVADILGLKRIRFYENGVVSFNLPLSAQVVGARATRTTHPQVINGFAHIISLVTGKKFTVENPFLWKTKTEVLRIIADADCSEMIKFATSCTHTWEMTKLKTHCGTCSQCIDRRFAVLACGMEAYDPAEAYGVDLLVGERSEGESRTMLAAYLETANEVAEMSALDFFGRFGEAARVLKHLEDSADTNALKLFELYQRHAQYVTKVVDDAIVKHRKEIRKRLLPPSCLLRLVCDSSVPEVRVDTPANQSDPKNSPQNYIRTRGECWTVRFNGSEEKIYKPEMGFAYLQILLSNPGVSFSAYELVCMVMKEPERYKLGDAGEVIDDETLSAYRTRLIDLKERRREAEGNNDLGALEKVHEEIEWLENELKRATGLGGRIRKAKDDRERVRNRVCNRIRSALKKIDQFDRSLAAHLKSPTLRLGYNPCYDPRPPVEWTT